MWIVVGNLAAAPLGSYALQKAIFAQTAPRKNARHRLDGPALSGLTWLERLEPLGRAGDDDVGKASPDESGVGMTAPAKFRYQNPVDVVAVTAF
jgi:hypothetical protein